MTNEYGKKWWTTEAMIRSGGSFVKGLGKLWRIGDSKNQAKLEKAFPKFFQDYRELGLKIKDDEVY